MCRLFIGADPDLWQLSTRSYRMDGMVTSVRLENLFWTTLDDIAGRDGLNIPQLLHRLYNESLDEGYDMSNFTSFLRVCCLRYLSLQLDGHIPTDQNIEIGSLPAQDILEIEHKSSRARISSEHMN